MHYVHLSKILVRLCQVQMGFSWTVKQLMTFIRCFLSFQGIFHKLIYRLLSGSNSDHWKRWQPRWLLTQHHALYGNISNDINRFKISPVLYPKFWLKLLKWSTDKKLFCMRWRKFQVLFQIYKQAAANCRYKSLSRALPFV